MVRALLLFGALLPTLLADTRSEAVERLLAPLRSATAPGCAVGIIQNGRFVYKTAFGLADMEQAVPITAATAFNVASISKQFTAAAIYFLLQSGQLHLTDPVRRIVPELPPYGDSMTIADLLHHTSGLRDITPLLEAAGRLSEPADVAGHLKLLASQSALNFPPGTDYEYTNSDYLLLSVIVERLSGKSLAEFAEERIFRPLEMMHSQFRGRIEGLKERATGYVARGGQFRRVAAPLLVAGDGGLYTSLDDLLPWDQNFYSAKLGGKALVEFMETRGRLRSGEPVQYAAGLQIGQYRGLATVSHDGWLPGYRSDLIRFPSQHLSVACLCNRSDADTTGLARGIASIYLAGKLKPSSRPANLDYVTSDFPELGGAWESKQGWIIWTWSGVDGLTVESADGHYKLVPLNRRQLFTEDGGYRLVLTELSRDRVKLEWDGFPPVVYGRLQTVMPRKAELGELTGDYRSNDAGARYHIFLSEQGRLMIGTSAGGRIPLEPVGSDRFLFGPWSLHFIRAEGRVRGLELHRARLWSLWFERAESPVSQ